MIRINYDLHARDLIMPLGQQTRIMGIINCTPDSFSGDGKLAKGKIDLALCLRYARRIALQGSDIIDIGGESTRPGASPVDLKEEIKRVIPVINRLARDSKIPLSVDTSKLEVAHRALDAGALIVNNIRGINLTKAFLKVVRDYKAGIVIMHMRGTPLTMQSKARYKDLIKEVIEELEISIDKCLQIGIKKESIIIDPGIGFAKTVDQNLSLIKNLNRLNILRCPIMLGTSRKSFIGHVLEDHNCDRLMGTAATVGAGIIMGAHIVRVHDVKVIKETVKITDAILNAQS